MRGSATEHSPTFRPTFRSIFFQVLLRINFIKALAIVTSYNAVAWQPAETCLRSAGVVSTALRQQICVWVVSTALPRIPIAVSDVRDAVYFGSLFIELSSTSDFRQYPTWFCNLRSGGSRVELLHLPRIQHETNCCARRCRIEAPPDRPSSRRQVCKDILINLPEAMRIIRIGMAKCAVLTPGQDKTAVRRRIINGVLR